MGCSPTSYLALLKPHALFEIASPPSHPILRSTTYKRTEREDKRTGERGDGGLVAWVVSEVQPLHVNGAHTLETRTTTGQPPTQSPYEMSLERTHVPDGNSGSPRGNKILASDDGRGGGKEEGISREGGTGGTGETTKEVGTQEEETGGEREKERGGEGKGSGGEEGKGGKGEGKEGGEVKRESERWSQK